MMKAQNAPSPNMTLRAISSLTPTERLNFLITNRIPRLLANRFIGWYSQIESPLLTRLSISVWSFFADDLKLHESKKQSFRSLRECFIRELKDDLRKIDSRSQIVVSPCDAIVGACGDLNGDTLFQTKGFPYELSDLIADTTMSKKYRNGVYVTLRLKSSMYHRFHSPIDCEIDHINYISGDTWNVNPITVKTIEKLYCKNERIVVELKTGRHDRSIAMVPVAAILVSSIKLHCLPFPLDLKYKGPNKIDCNAKFDKGDEMGYFQHGSTIILFGTGNYILSEGIRDGLQIQMGQSLLTEN